MTISRALPRASTAPDRPARRRGSGRVLVVSRDAFGRHLGATLDRLGLEVQVASLLPAAGAGTGGATVVVAGQRPDADLLEELAERAWRSGTAFLPVGVEQPQLVVGPYVVPGRSACLRCYARRIRQHDPAAESSAHLAAAYAADASLRPGGWLPALADLAAGLVASSVTGGPGALRPGEVRMLDVLTLVPSAGALVGFTGCPVCDPGPTADRSWSSLAAAWPALLGGSR